MFSQNSVSALATELDKLSRIMGNKDVRTTFNGSGAYTDGKNVNVPAMDMDAELDPTHQAIMRGYHIHEVSHVTDTDFGVFKKRGVKKIKGTWNACEDVFVERKAMEKFPGARRSLQQTVNHVLTRENKHWADNPEENEKRREKWWTEIPYAALQVARRKMGYDSEALDQYIDEMPKELMNEARKFSTKMIDADNSHDALAVARAIERRMKKLGEDYVEEEEEKKKKLRQSGDDDSNNNSADKQDHEEEVTTGSDRGDDDAGVENPSDEGDDGDGTDGANDNDGDDDDDDGDGTNGGGGDEEGDDDSGGDGGGGGDDGDGDDYDDDDTGTNAEPIDPTEGGFSTEEAEKRAMDAFNALFGKYQSKKIELVCRDKTEVFDDHVQVWQYMFEEANKKINGERVGRYLRESIQNYRDWPKGNDFSWVKETTRQYLESMPDDVRLYAARLARLLLSQEDRRKEGGHRSGKLDARRLSQIKAGNTHVFARNSVTKTAETRIMVAVDGSSSMQNQPTITAILALNQCLGRANVKFDIVEWGGVTHAHTDEVFGNKPWMVYHKRASDNWRKINTGLEFQPVGGDTSTLSAMTAVARIMSEWQEPRRVLLFLTDGRPNGYTDECEIVGNLVADMFVGGIETYGVYIGKELKDDSPANDWMGMMFGDKWTPTTFEKLGETLLGGIEKLLIKGGHAHAA